MKQLFLVLSLFTTICLPAQPFLSVTATTKGEGVSAGYLEEQSGVEFSAGYNTHLYKGDVPTLYYLSVGKRISLSHKDEDNFSITPSIGYATWSVQDFSHYDDSEGPGAIIQVKKLKALYGFELGKDWYLGRLYLTANYCKKPFLGIGIRAFLK